jgi:hypothetical protein
LKQDPISVGTLAVALTVLLVLTAFRELPNELFHLEYFVLLGLIVILCFTSGNHFERVLPLFLIVLTLLWILFNFGGVNVVKFSSDQGTEWQLAQWLIGNGHLPHDSGLRKLSVYAANPGLEIIAAVFELVAVIPADTFLSLAGPVLSSATVLLIFVFYRRFLGRTKFAMKTLIVATFSASMLTYGALAIHQTLGFVMVWSILVLLVIHARSSWTNTICIVLAGTALAVSHSLTPVLFSIAILVYLVLSSLMRGRLAPGEQIFQWRHLIVIVLLTVAWNAFISVIPTGIVFGALLEFSLSAGTGYIQTALTSSGTKPDWVLVTMIVGFISYAVFSVIGLLKALRSRTLRYTKLIPLAMAGGAVWLLLLTTPLGRVIASTGIQARGLLYIYFLGSPLFVIGLQESSRLTASRRRLPHWRLAPYVILFLALSPAVYYGFPSYVYDQHAPVTHSDPRLGALAMYGALEFALSSSVNEEIPVVWVAYGMSQGSETIQFRRLDTLIPSKYGSLDQLMQSHCGQIVILRHSITQIADPGYTVTVSDYRMSIHRSNIVYSSGDPFILASYCSTG